VLLRALAAAWVVCILLPLGIALAWLCVALAAGAFQ
jgi:hypothetical protein